MEVHDVSFLPASLAYVCGTTDNTRKRALIPNFLGANNKRPKTTQESAISSIAIKRKLHEADGPLYIKRICLVPSVSPPPRKRKHDNTMNTTEQRDQILSNEKQVSNKKSKKEPSLGHSITGQEEQKDSSELLKAYNDYNWWKKELPSLEDEMVN